MSKHMQPGSKEPRAQVAFNMSVDLDVELVPFPKVGLALCVHHGAVPGAALLLLRGARCRPHAQSSGSHRDVTVVRFCGVRATDVTQGGPELVATRFRSRVPDQWVNHSASVAAAPSLGFGPPSR
jgi:hypothetical protein